MIKLIFFLCLCSAFVSSTNIKQKIYHKLQKLQWQHNKNFIFGLQWEHIKGLYESDIKFNVVDSKNTWKSTEFRKIFNVDDNNMFVTNFVMMALLEVSELQQELIIDEKSLHLALEAVLSFKDKNYEGDLPIFNFWKQKFLNDTWVAFPNNLDHLVKVYPNFPPIIQKWLDNHGFGIFNQVKQISQAFRIPADNDDSSVNIALEATLFRLKEKFPSLYKTFEQQNYNFEEFYQQALKYAYRPFHDGKDIIDARSFYYLHPFLNSVYEQAILNGEEPNLILATTWLLDDETTKPGLVEMPLLTNNIDVSVNANFLFGLTNQVINGKISLSGELRQLYHDITKLLVYVIDNGIPEERPDIALLYYPSQFDFYWFNSRIVKLVQRQQYESDTLITDSVNEIHESLKNRGTIFLLSKIQCNTKYCYSDEFLGDYAGKNRGEDRIFATSLTVNILLDTWTDINGQWLEETTENIRLSVSKSIRFLEDHYSENKYQNNVFFSGSIKGLSTVHVFYPTNVDIDEKGNSFDPQKATINDLKVGVKCAWKGFVTLEEYQELLKQKWFGFSVPQTFNGFNSEPGAGFPFWSSKAISHAMTLLAISKFELISQQ